MHPTMRMTLLSTALVAAAAQAQTAAPTPEQMQAWQREVRAAECGFAASMARRDLAAFERHLAESTLFFMGPNRPLHGRAAVVAAWKRFYEGPEAPFQWEPDEIAVSPDGQFGYSTGPVRNAKGELTNRFNSVWRREGPGRWIIVIDRGAPLTEQDHKAPQPLGKGCDGIAAP